VSMTEPLPKSNPTTSCSMTESLLKNHHIIFCEMMSHPVLFTHPHPKSVAILGDDDNSILSEVLKHTDLTDIHLIQDAPLLIPFLDGPKIIRHDRHHWLKEPNAHDSLDILITLNEPTPTVLQDYFNLLHKEGILIQASASPFDPLLLKSLITQLKTIGFHDLHIIHFPQPHYPSGWRTATIALKYGVFKRLREKAIYNKPFKTHYYNFDIHRASMVLPEFMRDTMI
jgi:spermidine synthase